MLANQSGSSNVSNVHPVVIPPYNFPSSHLTDDYEGALLRVPPPLLLHPLLLLHGEGLRAGQVLQLLPLQPELLEGQDLYHRIYIPK